MASPGRGGVGVCGGTSHLVPTPLPQLTVPRISPLSSCIMASSTRCAGGAGWVGVGWTVPLCPRHAFLLPRRMTGQSWPPSWRAPSSSTVELSCDHAPQLPGTSPGSPRWEALHWPGVGGTGDSLLPVCLGNQTLATGEPPPSTALRGPGWGLG